MASPSGTVFDSGELDIGGRRWARDQGGRSAIAHRRFECADSFRDDPNDLVLANDAEAMVRHEGEYPRALRSASVERDGCR
jgi:hypothetical protein